MSSFQYIATDEVQHISALSNFFLRKMVVKLKMTGARKKQKADNCKAVLVYRKIKRGKNQFLSDHEKESILN